MEDYENIYDKIKELLGSHPSQFNVLEEKIDIEVQLEYFELSRRMKNTVEPEIALESASKLFESSTTHEEKKSILARIATLEKIEAYRTIERFQKETDGDLRNWSILALQENRMLLESHLLDENQVFISTGLGGKGEKLRYFIVVFGKESFGLSELQKKIIRNEFEISLKKHNSELEELNFSGSVATLMAIIPLRVILKKIFTDAIEECNQYGDFLISNFIISNVKAMSFEEIGEYVKTQNNSPEFRVN
jgi:hypothetical protein